MVYMFLDINRMGIKVRQVVSSIEAGLIEWLRGEGIPATCVKGSPGVYVLNEDERFEKIAAIGLNFSRGISMHGFALYLLEDDEPFSLIEPCGEKGALVTSVEAQSSKSLMPKNCYESVVAQIIESLSLHCKTA
jgi:lipoyl(octanoyl) transferase